MIIRKAQKDDYKAIFVLLQELTGNISMIDQQLGLRKWHQIIEHPGTTVFCAQINDDLVSTATLHILPNMTFNGRPYALIENVITSVNYRGQNIGRQLMLEIMETAWQADAYKIMLLTGKQTGAKEFYEKLGFTEDQKHGMICRKAPQRGFS